MSEYIGSHISLISKSDIRYIGTLHEINSESSTVALENVRSYGTEGRRGTPGDEIPGSDQVYEYIVFRGSDVKELSIVEAPKESKAPAVPNDPAILGSARPQQGPLQPQNQPQFQQQQQQPPQHFQPPYDFQQGPHPHHPPPPPHFQQQPPPRFQNAGGPHGFPGQPGAVPGYNPGFGPPPNFGYGPPGPGFPNGPPAPYNQPQQGPIAPPVQQQQQQRQQQQQQQQQPQQQPGKPEHLQHIRSDVAQRPAEMSATPTPIAAQHSAPPPPLDSKPTNTATQAASAAADSKPNAKKAPNSRVAVPLPTAPKVPAKPSTTAKPPSKPQSYADATSAATAAVAAAMAQLNTSATTQPASGVDNLTQKVNQMRVQDAGLQQRGRGRGRGTVGAPRGGARREQRGVDVPKEDFDFASSNAKFNKQDLVKEAIASGSPVPSPAADSENTNSLENGHANGADADDVVIPPKPSAERTYDKKTSFFDNLSSDLRDRAANQDVDGRALRYQERNKNVETFGQGSVDSGRGGYRGRGRGRGFGRGRASAGAGYAARGAYNAAAAAASTDDNKGRNRGVAA